MSSDLDTSISQLQLLNSNLEEQIEQLKWKLNGSGEDTKGKSKDTKGKDVKMNDTKLKYIYNLYNINNMILKEDVYLVLGYFNVYISNESMEKIIKEEEVKGIDFDGLEKIVEKAKLVGEENKLMLNTNDLLLLKFKINSKIFMKSLLYYKNIIIETIKLSNSNDEITNINLGIKTLNYNQASSKTCINIEYFDNAVRTDAANAGAPSCVYIDLQCSENANDEQLGELFGCIQTLFDGIQSELPLPCNFFGDVIDAADEHPRRFRIGVSTDVCLDSIGVNLNNVIKNLVISINLATSLLDIFKPDFRLYELMKLSANVDLKINKNVVSLLSSLFADRHFGPYILFSELLDEFKFHANIHDPENEIGNEGCMSNIPFINEPNMIPFGKIASEYRNIMKLLPSSIITLLDLTKSNLVGIYEVRIQSNSIGLNINFHGMNIFDMIDYIDKNIKNQY